MILKQNIKFVIDMTKTNIICFSYMITYIDWRIQAAWLSAYPL